MRCSRLYLDVSGGCSPWFISPLFDKSSGIIRERSKHVGIPTSLLTRFDPHLTSHDPQTRLCHYPDGVVLRGVLPLPDPTSHIRLHRMVVVGLFLDKSMLHRFGWKVGSELYGEVFNQRASQGMWFRKATVCVLRKRAKSVYLITLGLDRQIIVAY